MKNKKVLFLTQAAVIAALYVVLTYLVNALGLASGVIQIRLSEALAILPFYPCNSRRVYWLSARKPFNGCLSFRHSCGKPCLFNRCFRCLCASQTQMVCFHSYHFGKCPDYSFCTDLRLRRARCMVVSCPYRWRRRSNFLRYFRHHAASLLAKICRPDIPGDILTTFCR